MHNLCDDDDEQQPLLQDQGVSKPVPSQLLINHDRHVAEATTSSALGYFALTVLLLGEFVANVDSTFVLAVYNDIASNFQDIPGGPWLLLGENLAIVVSLPIYGFLADRYSNKPLLIATYFLLICGSLVSSFATSLWIVVLGRVLAGLASAGMTAITASIIVKNAKASEVGVLRGYVAVAGILGRTLGGPFGGLLTDLLGWRSSFLCEIPFVTICWVFVVFFLEDGKEERMRKDGTENEDLNSTSDRTIDLGGIALFDLALIFLLLTIGSIERERDLGHPKNMIFASAFLMSSILFLFFERSLGQRAFIPLSLFQSSIGIQIGVQFVICCVQFSLLTHISALFIRVCDTSTAQAALALVPSAIGNATGNFLAGRLVRWLHRYKVVSHCGLVVTLIGYILVTVLWQHDLRLWKCLFMFLAGFGNGLLNCSQFVALAAVSPRDRSSLITSTFFLAQKVGGAVGIGASSATVERVFEHNLIANLPLIENKTEVIQRIIEDMRYAFSLPELLQNLVAMSYSHAFSILPVIACGVAVLLQFVISIPREVAIE